MQRRLYRRLRFPVYNRATRSRQRRHREQGHLAAQARPRYPAFPRSRTRHIRCLVRSRTWRASCTVPAAARGVPPWLGCALDKFAATGEGKRALRGEGRGAWRRRAEVRRTISDHSPTATKAKRLAVLKDVLREWMPLVLTLLIRGRAPAARRERRPAGVDRSAASLSAPKSKEDHETRATASATRRR